MWTNSILKKFNLKTGGDEGYDQDPPEDQNNNDGGDPGDDQDNNSDDNGDDLDDTDPEALKKQIKKLRAENAKRRLKEKKQTERMTKYERAMKILGGDDEEEEDPEKQLDTVSQYYESAVTRNAILELALVNGVSGDNLEYFEFLMGKTLDSLEEGDEVTEEQLEEILSKCSSAGGGRMANTSTKDAGRGGRPPGNSDSDEVSQEEFNKMGIMQKSALYSKNPALYEKLMSNATMR